MKTILKFILIFFPVMGSLAAKQDTIYVMRSGMVVYKKAITDIDSISFENTLINRTSIIQQIASEPNYSLFYQALVATGLVDSLQLDRDRSYKPINYSADLISFGKISGTSPTLPQFKRYGFTVLIESDSIFNAQNISSLSALKSYAASVYNVIYPEDAGITDPKNRKNSLNRFIAYHLINKKLSTSQFIDLYDTGHMNKTMDLYEYLEPMCPNSLIEIKKERSTGFTNLINSADGTAIRIIKTFANQNEFNGYYYGIDKIMCFDATVINNLSNKRLRFDASSLFPEITNNNIRAVISSSDKVVTVIPSSYCNRLKRSERTLCCYSIDTRYEDFEGDEMLLRGIYDFTITTPPIPSGSYEVRFGYAPTVTRGVAEFYVDGISAGAPVDLRLLSNNPEIGYVTPGTDLTDLSGYENDKQLRNHGYMKGPDSYSSILKSWYPATNARYSSQSLRKIIGTFNFASFGNHTITVKGLTDSEFGIDYLEFVPVSALANEDTH